MLYTKVEEDANRSLFSLSYIKLTQFMTIKHLKSGRSVTIKVQFRYYSILWWNKYRIKHL
jgi:hypothetical protein